MSYIAEIGLDHPNKPLNEVLTRFPESVIRLAYATDMEDGGNIGFAVVTQCEEWSDIDEALLSDTSCEDTRCLFTGPTFAVYRFHWVEGPDLNIWEEMASIGVFVERVWAADGQWHARLHLPSRQLVGQVKEVIESFGISVDLDMLCVFQYEDGAASATNSQMGLLKRAYEEGYFMVPRGIQQSELAKEFNISESAVSQQIRRGLHNVLGEYFQYGSRTSEPFDSSYFEEVTQG